MTIGRTLLIVFSSISPMYFPNMWIASLRSEGSEPRIDFTMILWMSDHSHKCGFLNTKVSRSMELISWKGARVSLIFNVFLAGQTCEKEGIEKRNLRKAHADSSSRDDYYWKLKNGFTPRAQKPSVEESDRRNWCCSQKTAWVQASPLERII